MKRTWLVGFTVSAICAVAGATDTVSDNFDSGISPVLWERYVSPTAYDPWTVAAPDAEGRLMVSKPADPGALDQTIRGGVRSRLVLIGDFTVSVDFELVDYPHPGLGYNEAFLQVNAENGIDHFGVLKFSIRRGDQAFDEAFEGWSVPPALPTVQLEDAARSGRFQLERQANTMLAFVDIGAGMVPLGSYSDPAFGGPMTVQLYAAQVVRPATGSRPFSALDVRYDNFYAEAEAIVPEPATLAALGRGVLGLTLRRRTGRILD